MIGAVPADSTHPPSLPLVFLRLQCRPVVHWLVPTGPASFSLPRIHDSTPAKCANMMDSTKWALLGSVLTLVVAVALGFALVQTGVYNVAADRPPGAFKRWLLSSTKRASIERRASEIEVPDLSGFEKVMRGAQQYQKECAPCHGTPDRKPLPFARAMNPPAPWLCDSSKTVSQQDLRRWFWATKHGIEMTGMPAWGQKKSDRQIWTIVASIKKCVETENRIPIRSSSEKAKESPPSPESEPSD